MQDSTYITICDNISMKFWQIVTFFLKCSFFVQYTCLIDAKNKTIPENIYFGQNTQFLFSNLAL